jgi:multidrug efflux system membrane fusion protein
MEQQHNGRPLSPHEDSEELARSFAGQGTPSYGGDLGVSFEKHNSSPELWVDSHKRTSIWVWIILFLVILLAVFLVVRLIHAKPAAATGAGGGRHGNQGPAAITVGQSQIGNINIYDDALGTVTPLNTVTVYSQITGQVQSVHYREGQIVRKGDPLVDIDPRPYEATLAQAEGTLQRDQAVLAQANIDLARYRAAYARNAIAKQTLDDQEQAAIQDQGTVQTDQATVAYDKVELAYCHIVAPISGRVGLRLVDPGNTVFSGSSSTLVVITQLNPITVVFNVSEDDLPQIETQLKAHKSLEVDAYDRGDTKEIEKGKLNALDNQIDTTTGTLKFRATFANKNYDLFPNQFVNARLLVKTLTDTVLIPTAAVQHNGTAAFVYVVTNGAPKSSEPASKPAEGDEKQGQEKQEAANATVTVQPITVLTSNENETAVQGINAGLTLATSGFDRLENKAPVAVHQGKSGQKPATGTATATSPGTAAP